MNNLSDILKYMNSYGLKANDLARICGINPSLMRQYALGIKQPGPKTIAKINEKIRTFADELKEFQITGA